MEKTLNSINEAIDEKYMEIRQQEEKTEGLINRQRKIISRIEKAFNEINFANPQLAFYIKKRMMCIAKEKGDLP